MLGLLWESRASFVIFPPVSSTVLAARQPLSLAPDDNLLYVLSASLPRLSAFSSIHVLFPQTLHFFL